MLSKQKPAQTNNTEELTVYKPKLNSDLDAETKHHKKYLYFLFM